VDILVYRNADGHSSVSCRNACYGIPWCIGVP